MPRKVLICGGHGLGDCLLSLQCAHYVQKAGNTCAVNLFTREEVFNPIQSLFGHLFSLKRENVELTPDTQLYVLKDEEAYLVLPDWLFSNANSFDWKKYGTNPQIIKSTRLLLDQHKNNGVIYLGLMTSTQGYLYEEIEELAVGLAKKLPEYSVYLPLLSTWAGQKIKDFSFKDVPKNLIIEKDPNFTSSLSVLKEAVYFVGTDNGPSHIAYHLGVPRLILDPQYGKLPWVARWKEDPTESIPITSGWPDVMNVVKTNLERPETMLIPRANVLTNVWANQSDWKKILLNKF